MEHLSAETGVVSRSTTFPDAAPLVYKHAHIRKYLGLLQLAGDITVEAGSTVTPPILRFLMGAPLR